MDRNRFQDNPFYDRSYISEAVSPGSDNLSNGLSSSSCSASMPPGARFDPKFSGTVLILHVQFQKCSKLLFVHSTVMPFETAWLSCLNVHAYIHNVLMEIDMILIIALIIVWILIT